MNKIELLGRLDEIEKGGSNKSGVIFIKFLRIYTNRTMFEGINYDYTQLALFIHRAVTFWTQTTNSVYQGMAQEFISECFSSVSTKIQYFPDMSSLAMHYERKRIYTDISLIYVLLDPEVHQKNLEFFRRLFFAQDNLIEQIVNIFIGTFWEMNSVPIEDQLRRRAVTYLLVSIISRNDKVVQVKIEKDGDNFELMFWTRSVADAVFIKIFANDESYAWSIPGREISTATVAELIESVTYSQLTF